MNADYIVRNAQIIKDAQDVIRAKKLQLNKAKQIEEKTIEKVKEMNKIVPDVINTSNEKLTTYNKKANKSYLYVKNSESFIITSDKEEVRVGHGLFCEKKIKKR